MLDDQSINVITLDIARPNLGESNVGRVIVEPATDSRGNEAVRITVVLQPGAVERITGDQALGFLGGLHDQLWQRGEERSPIVSYATEEELADNASGSASEQADF